MQLQVNDKMQLRSLVIEDAKPLNDIIETNRVFFRDFLNWPDMPEDLAATTAFVQQKIDNFEQGLGPHFAIIYEGVICGMGGYHQMDLSEKVGSVGCWLDAEYISKGIASEGALSVIEVGFEHYGLDKVEIRCTAGNHASQTIAKRLGFTLVETLPNELEMNGQLQDVVVYSLLAEHLR